MHWSTKIMKLDQFIGLQARHSRRTAQCIFFLFSSKYSNVNNDCEFSPISPTVYGYFFPNLKKRLLEKQKWEWTNPDSKRAKFDITICFCNKWKIFWTFVSYREKKYWEASKAPGWGGSKPQIHSVRTFDRHSKPRRLSARLYKAYATTLKHFWVCVLINNTKAMFEKLDRVTVFQNCTFVSNDMLGWLTWIPAINLFRVFNQCHEVITHY